MVKRIPCRVISSSALGDDDSAAPKPDSDTDSNEPRPTKHLKNAIPTDKNSAYPAGTKLSAGIVIDLLA